MAATREAQLQQLKAAREAAAAKVSAAASEVLALVPACLQDMKLLEGRQAAVEGAHACGAGQTLLALQTLPHSICEVGYTRPGGSGIHPAVHTGNKPKPCCLLAPCSCQQEGADGARGIG